MSLRIQQLGESYWTELFRASASNQEPDEPVDPYPEVPWEKVGPAVDEYVAKKSTESATSTAPPKTSRSWLPWALGATALVGAVLIFR